jgi:hypothetical protein
MTFYDFRRLSPVVQLYWVLKYGTFLAKRWEADDDGVNLYHCADEGRAFLSRLRWIMARSSRSYYRTSWAGTAGGL